MAQYLTLSRAARLVGAKRGTLQRKISAGELATFEGKIELSDLMTAFPDAQLEDRSMLERVDRIKSRATPRLTDEDSGLPDLETVSARVSKLSEELARARAKVSAYRALFDELKQHLDELESQQGPSEAIDVRTLKLWLLQALERQTQQPPPPEQLLLKDTMLRIVAAHVQVFPSGHEFFVQGNDSILDAGLRAGLALPFGCSDGSCGQCKARLLAGKVKLTRGHAAELTEHERQLGYVLMCSNTAVTDTELQVEEAAGPQDIPRQELETRIAGVQRPRDDILLLQLRMPAAKRLRFLAGQHAQIRAPSGAKGSYSIASCPCEENRLEFHIRDEPGEAFAEYAFRKLSPGDSLVVEGPAGNFAVNEDSPHSLVLIGWDTGFAPLKGMIEHALALDIAETIHFYWLSDETHPHYAHNLCRSWQDALDNFRYTPLTISGRARPVRGKREGLFQLPGHPQCADAGRSPSPGKSVKNSTAPSSAGVYTESM